MKKSRFLLLDAGPIIKLFELHIWEAFIKTYDVLIARSVVEQIIYKGEGDILDFIDYQFEESDRQGLLKIVDVEPSKVKTFLDKFNLSDKYAVDAGEDETIAYWYYQTGRPSICSSDGAVFSILGYLGGGEHGISLEEALYKMGHSKSVEWKYTKKFRQKFTHKGQIEATQSQDIS
jgi:hypothetical protein